MSDVIVCKTVNEMLSFCKPYEETVKQLVQQEQTCYIKGDPARKSIFSSK